MSQAMNMMTDMAIQNAGQSNLDTQRSHLENLSKSQDQATKEKELRKAAEGFEAIFIQKMWDEMRSSLPKDGMYHSKEEEYWQSMYSQELGKSMASAGGIGLADMMVEQLTRPTGTPQTGALSRIRMAVKPAPLLPENQTAETEKTAETAQNTVKQTAAQAAVQTAGQTNAQAAAQTNAVQQINTQANINPANFYEEYTARDIAAENTNQNQAPAQQAEEIAEETIQPQIIHTTYTTNLPPSKRTKALMDAKGNPIKKVNSSQSAERTTQVSTPQRNTKVVTEKTNFEVNQNIPEMPITFAGQKIETTPEPAPAPKAEPADMLAGISQTYIPYNQRIAMILASEKAMHAEELAQAEREKQMAQVAEQETKAAFKLPSLEDALRMGTLVASLSPQEEAQITDRQAKQAQTTETIMPEHIGGGTIVTNPPVFEHVAAVAPETAFTMPVGGTISSPFGWRFDPINNKRAWHTGLDIRANSGSAVTAGMQGTVTFAGEDPELGNMIIIDHGNGMETVYGHNSELLVKTGDTVTSGTQIARVGSSGRTNGSHLHFEIRQNGLSINPEPYFSKEKIS